MKTKILPLCIVLAGFAATAQPPVLLKDLATDAIWSSSSPSNFMRVEDRVFFSASAGSFYGNIFVTDGTESGTSEATIDEYTSAFVSTANIPFGNNLIVTGSSLSSNIYFNDGTANNEVAIIDDHAYDFTYGIGPTNSFVINDEVFFWAKRTGDNLGAELYKTDGTVAGTALFNDFNTGAGKGYAGFAATGHCINATADKAYIIASDGDSIGVYSTDGTNISHLKNIMNDAIGADAYFYPVVVGGYAYYRTLYGVWSIDITNNSIESFSPPTNAYIVGIYHMDGKLYMLTQDGFAKRDLYAIDGTSQTTVADDFATSDGTITPWAYSTLQCEADGRFFFTVHPSALQPVQLWVSDGTEAGTVKALDSIGVSGNGVDYIYACNDRTFYYQTGAEQTLFEINMTAYALEEFVDNPESKPYMDETDCRLYFGYNDATAMVEPHYIDLGAPVVTTLNPPTNLMANAAARAEGTVDLSWQDNSNNEDGFYIERSTDSVNFTQIADVVADITTYADTNGILASTKYHYRVKAYNSTEVSAASNIATATTYSLSVGETQAASIRIFPNPANDEFSIYAAQNGSYRVFDLRGSQLLTNRIVSGLNKVDITMLNSGVYFVEVRSGTGVYTSKLVVQ